MMMKAIYAASVAAVALVVLTGCSSVQVASPTCFSGQQVVSAGNALGHVGAATHGLYFLKWPLITGSMTTIGMPTLLEDTVNPNALSQMVASKSKEMGGTRIIDLTTGFADFGLLFKYRTATASGTVVK